VVASIVISCCLQAKNLREGTSGKTAASKKAQKLSGGGALAEEDVSGSQVRDGDTQCTPTDFPCEMLGMIRG
jgi:hypothetical protein